MNRQRLQKPSSCACFLGRTAVATYFLTHGVDPSGGTSTGLNAFHWAANRGQLEAVRLLIGGKHRSNREACTGGSVLDTAVWSAINEPRPAHVQIVEELLEAVRADEEWPTGHKEIDAILKSYKTV